jgi:hypothetical protein
MNYSRFIIFSMHNDLVMTILTILFYFLLIFSQVHKSTTQKGCTYSSKIKNNNQSLIYHYLVNINSI